jgi:WD40 repeat protein
VPRLASTNVSALAFAGDTERFLVFSRLPGSATASTTQVQLWDFKKGAPVGSPLVYDPSRSNLVCAPNGRRFALFNGDRSNVNTNGANGVLVWEPARRTSTRMLDFPDECVECAAFDAQARWLAIGSYRGATGSGVLRLVDLEANDKSFILCANKQWFASVAFSPDRQWLAAAHWDDTFDPGAAMLWEVMEPGRRWDQPSSLPHLDGVMCTAFWESGQRIATGSEDQTAIVWRRTNGTWQPSLRPLRCGGEVDLCAFSRQDGRWLATSSRTPESQQVGNWVSKVQIWDTANSELITVPLGFPDRVTRLQFVAGDTSLFIERWIPPAPPQRWLIDLAVEEPSAQDFLVRAELLSAQKSFLRRGPQPGSKTARGTPSPEQALAYAMSLGPLRPLTKEDCRELWRARASSSASSPPSPPQGAPRLP